MIEIENERIATLNSPGTITLIGQTTDLTLGYY